MKNTFKKTMVINQSNEFIEHFQKVPVEVYPNSVSKDPLVSVIVQTYQHANYITECLNSILTQKTDFPFELLVGEDASKDGTREICIEFAKKHSDRIRLFLHYRENVIQINGKPTGRFNFLYNLINVKGKYIAICDGDDYWTDPYKLQKQVDALSKHPTCDMCIHPSHILVGKKIKGILNSYSPEEHIISAEQVLAGNGSMAPTPSYLLKASVLKNLPDWFSRVHVADVFVEILGSLNGGILYYPEVMAVYRKNAAGSWSERRNQLNSIERVKQIQDAKRSYEYLNNCLEPEFLTALDKRIVHIEFRIIQYEVLAFLENKEYKKFKKRIEELIIYQRLHGIKHLKMEFRILYIFRGLNTFTSLLHRFVEKLI